MAKTKILTDSGLSTLVGNIKNNYAPIADVDGIKDGSTAIVGAVYADSDEEVPAINPNGASAADISFNGTASGISATTVQGAIDELMALINALKN